MGRKRKYKIEKENKNKIQKKKDKKPKESGKSNTICAIKKRLNKKLENDIVKRKENSFMKKKLTICMGTMIFNITRL